MLAQAPAFEEMEFEPDSVKAAYKPAGKNHVYIRSKRGSNGLNRTPAADAILSAEVTEIVLVFSEIDPSAIAEREEANRERWENLLKTYPELFQYSTTYKNICQCNARGDSATFKKMQGFYVYINGEVPKVEEPKSTAPPTVKTEVSTPVAKPAIPPAATTGRVTAQQEAPPVEKPAVKTKEVEIKKEKEKPAVETVKEADPPPVAEPVEETSAPVVKEKTKKTGIVKPRRAKDARACRQPCYGFGDEDFNLFFKDNFTFTKKQRRKAKNWVAQVRLQIHFDGSIKKVIVTGSEEAFNLQVQEVLKVMNNWNAAVKGGVAVKSEIRFTLKYDKETKSMKPFDVNINPRPSPKCPCVTDSEIFAD